MATLKPKELFPGAEDMPQVYLKPGELFVAWEPTIITTLLGSCISIIIHVPHNRTTAVSHCTLPHQDKAGVERRLAFVDTAMEYMVDTLKVKSVPATFVKVKVFGGSDVVSKRQLPAGRTSIGSQNIAAVQEAIARYGLTVDACKVGGKRGYRIFVRSDTGETHMRYLSNALSRRNKI